MLALLAAPQNIGTVRVLRPLVTLSEQTQPKALLPSSPSSSETKAHRKTIAEPSTPDIVGKSPPFWETLAGTLMVEEGRVIVQGKQEKNRALDGIFSGSSTLAAGTVQYALQWLAGDGIGKLLGKGFVNLPARRQNILDTLVARLQLQVSNLQIAPLLTLAARSHNVPEGRVLLNGKLTVTGAGRDTLDVVGNLNCTDIELTGGVLGVDHPQVQRLSILIDGSKKSRDDWRITQLDIDGDPGKITVTGEFGKSVGHARITGAVQLPVLFSQFPHLLQVQQGTLVESGAMMFFTELTRADSQQEIIADVAIDALQGTRNKKPFFWDNALTLSLRAEQDDDDFLFKRMNFSTSFLQVTGKGSLEDFSFQLDADLEKASQELSQVFKLQWGGSGKISLEVASGLHDDNRYAVDFQLKSPKLSLSKDDRVILPEHPLHLNGKISVPETWWQDRVGADVQIDGSCWPGSLSLALNGVSYSAQAMTAGYELSTRWKLDRLADILHTTQSLSDNTTLSGDMTLDAAGFFTDNQVVVREFNAQIVDFENIRGETGTREKKLTMQIQLPPLGENNLVGIRKLLVVDNLSSWLAQGCGLSGYDWGSQRLFVRDLGLRSTSVQLNVNELVIDDLKESSQSWYADLHDASDLTPQAAGEVVKKEMQKLFPGLFAGKKL